MLGPTLESWAHLLALPGSARRYRIISHHGAGKNLDMRISHNPAHSKIRGLGALCTATFLFFLIYTAPHRVHHFFDQAGPLSHARAGEHSRDADRPSPARDDTDCVFQASASRCAASITAEPPTLPSVKRYLSFAVPVDHRFSHRFVAAPFQSRAPPLA